MGVVSKGLISALFATTAAVSAAAPPDTKPAAESVPVTASVKAAAPQPATTPATVPKAAACSGPESGPLTRALAEGCIERKIKDIFTTAGDRYSYKLTDLKQENKGELSQFAIFDKNARGVYSKPEVGVVDLNMDTVRFKTKSTQSFAFLSWTSEGESVAPIGNFSKKAQDFFVGSFQEACAGFKENLSTVPQKVNFEIDAYAKMKDVSKDDVRELRDSLAGATSNLKKAVDTYCPAMK